jgi:flagellar assembly factor FliW
MKCAEMIETEQATEAAPSVIHMPAGLLGFEKSKDYVLLASEAEAPFMWLKMVEEPKLAFLVVSPTYVLDIYQPDISPEDVEFLGLQSGEDAWVLNIVTMHRDGTSTVNLKGPLIINRHTLVAKQVVPLNAASFALQHPLPVATS